MQEFLQAAFPWIILAFLLLGQAGTFIPLLPGLWIQWAAALVYGLVTGFDLTGGILFGIITLLVIIGGIIDNVAMGASAKTSGASWLSIGAALIGGVVGSLVFPPLGGLILAMGGIFLVEYLRIRDLRKAWDSTRGLAVGCGWGAVLRFGFGLLVILVWLLWAFVF
ncbi:uncharacterized protein conserved in bacteria [Bellilinea caldifistulae]|uniref:DUF456 domain-containing protein n=1 Tax=Bellilinea caldifistulae TaxID=360411 RepID=A0A0P6Y1H4_9CHLR|nr:DUF456 domain-containing protein [Bellilinea caldifistulae]KPL75404.1 hypothetical protein AC812_08975 [Bellilinea caldifistulae]GAP09839.1 uncharacterized protein conserved in bacteria [Bellilinea caldifistulae]